VGDRKRRRRELLHRQAVALQPFLDGAAGSLILCPLCLRLHAEANWPHLSVEDAPPQQYDGGTQRCMTCRTGNSIAGGSFETAVAMLNSERAEALRRAEPPRTTTSGLVAVQTRLLVPFSTAFHLASVQDDEKQLELKSAYLIAYATLGHSYILGTGLEQVRETHSTRCRPHRGHALRSPSGSPGRRQSIRHARADRMRGRLPPHQAPARRHRPRSTAATTRQRPRVLPAAAAHAAARELGRLR
jgi:hypothetical protein